MSRCNDLTSVAMANYEQMPSRRRRDKKLKTKNLELRTKSRGEGGQTTQPPNPPKLSQQYYAHFDKLSASPTELYGSQGHLLSSGFTDSFNHRVIRVQTESHGVFKVRHQICVNLSNQCWIRHLNN
jgi:hypothetical protein